VPRVIRATLFYLLGGIVVVLHLLGYAQPGLIVGSRLVNWVAIPVLFAAAFLLQRRIRVPASVWKKDPVIKRGSLVLAVLTAIEVLLYSALMFNVLARFDPKYLAVDSNPAFRMLEPQLGDLMVFSVLGILLWPAIVTGLRDGESKKDGPGENSHSERGTAT
jgi:hypothetical protein